ncbi:MAG: crotonase/enoyl-CoA hydratase family protein [Sphingomonadales bacterium]|nr:crotonase/enoyl-CoA hydratase family protein [Sphingomonadales bacterium]
MSEEVLISVADGVIEVTINRPEARNAMSKAAAEGIAAAMDRLDAENDLRCAILTGAGGTFCSGMDLKGFLSGEMPVAAGRGFGGLTDWTPKKPVIAAVDGYALAGGMELALACDLIVANVNAKFGVPEVKRGLVAAGGGVVQLPRLLPRPLAMELALTGDPITAQRAYDLGLINRVTDGPAIEAARALARIIAENGPLAVTASKGIVRDSWLWDTADVNAKQGPYIAHVFSSEDAREGAMAFAQKRKPNWQGK